MQLDEVKIEVIDRLGGRTDIERRVESWIYDAEIWLARCVTDLPTLDLSVTKRLITGQGEVNITTLLGITPLGLKLLRNKTTGWLMQRFPFEEFRALASQSSSNPIRWVRHGQILYFDPIPSVDTDIIFDYRAMPERTKITVGEEWREILTKLAVHIGWSALMESDKSKMAFSLLPGWAQMRLQQPLTQDEFEAMFDTDLRLSPWLKR